MRHFRLILAAMFLLNCLSLVAQDIITRTDGSTVKAKVEEISDLYVKYHKFENLKGPVYSIPLNTVATIKYANGSVDTFTDLKVEEPSTNPNQVNHNQTQNYEPLNENGSTMSDLELIRRFDSYDLLRKSKKYNLIGWIGGGVLGAAVVSTAIYAFVGYDMTYLLYEATLPLFVGGAAWTTGFCLYARSLKNKAMNMMVYNSMPVYEFDIVSNGKNRLAFSADIFKNKVNNSLGYGLGLSYTF